MFDARPVDAVCIEQSNECGMTVPITDSLQSLNAHTQAVRDWLAAPIHERGYYWTRIDIAWRQVRSDGLDSLASTTATGMMRANGKLKGIK